MTVDRLTRVNELLKREIGEALYQIIKEDDFDLSAVTITHVITSRSLQNARVMVSIRDHQDERSRMLSILRKYRGKIQERIGKDVILKYTPRLIFELDTSIEKGDAVLSLLHKMERQGELPPEDIETENASGTSGDEEKLT
jgi:ribosome-binding factor A